MAETVVISGEKITGAIAKFQSNIKRSWCACADSSVPAFSMSGEIKKGYVDAKRRGVRIRYVTEVTSGNLVHCKELTQLAELRHLAGVQGAFAVSEGEFVAGISASGRIEKLVYSNVPEVVAHQQDVFETLWAAAVPAAERIREIS